MHNNVKFVLRDEDIQVWWGSWYSDLSWGWAFVPFHMSWGWRSQKKIATPHEDNFWNSPETPVIITQPKSRYSFYRPTEGRRLHRPSWLVTYQDGLPARRWSPIVVLTGSDVAQLH